ncbi:CPBP family glutamic-type intramembrane protease [Microgenomates group bacterium]|nr:CPBP family glutamic-type intramembrane protease [Microgenomates group bacterium]
MFNKFYKSKLVLAAETLLLSAFLLFSANIFPHWLVYRYWVMLGGLIYVWLFVWSQHFGWKQLGFQLINFNRSLAVLIRPTLLTVLSVVALYVFLPLNYVYPLGVAGVGIYPVGISVLRYSFISVPLQEIIFRSYLINRASLVSKNQLLIRVYATTIFMLIHVPFKTTPIILGSLILGWIWTGNFLKFRNIYSVMLSHTVVGLTYVLLMFLLRLFQNQ